MKVRLKDIAEIAKVSVATVSTVLNNPESQRFSKEKRKEILELAKEMNYVPNKAARSLKSNRTYTIGILVPDLNNPFFASLAMNVQDQCRERGYTPILVTGNEKYANDIKMIEFLNEINVDGMLIALSGDSYGHESELIEILEKVNIPFVLMDRSLDGYKCNNVIFNNKHGEYLAAKHCLENGHRKIGYISASENSLSGYYRQLGFEKALREYKINIDLNIIKFGTYEFSTGYDNTESLVNSGVSAIVCANDLIAFGVIKKLKELEIRVPEDISVVGYDNLHVAELFGVGLTSVEQNTEMLAKESYQLLFSILNRKNKPKEVVLSTRLVIKSSVLSVG